MFCKEFRHFFWIHNMHMNCLFNTPLIFSKHEMYYSSPFRNMGQLSLSFGITTHLVSSKKSIEIIWDCKIYERRGEAKHKYNNVKRSIPAHPTFVNDAHREIHLWPVTSKINRFHPFTMVNLSAKFDEETQNGIVSILFISFFLYMSIATLNLDLWPPKSIGFIFSPWLKCRPSPMKKHITVKPLSCSQAYFHTCQLWPWPLTSKINRVHLLTMVNMSAKFDEETHKGLVSIVFTRSMHWRTHAHNHSSITLSPPQRVARG